jgi:hypothetical protein
MALVQRDYILRMIGAVAAAIARVLRRRESGDLSGARLETRIAVGEVLGPIAPIATNADSRTAADLLADPARLAAWARLLADDAQTLRQMGDQDLARWTDRRALELLLEARLRGAVLDHEAAASLESLRELVAPDVLAPRYQDALRQS